jgi:hypothetical protein
LTEMDVAAWQKRLEEHFSTDHVVGRDLVSLYSSENAYEQFIVSKLHGYLVLMDSFQSFFAHTLALAEDKYRASYSRLRLEWYTPYLLNCTMLFRRFRAAAISALHGYPFAGYAMLRDVKDQAILMAAAARNLTTWKKVTGFEEQIDLKKPPLANLEMVKKHRVKEERRVFKLMLGAKCGLDESDRQRVLDWTGMFDTEMHGSQMSFVMDGTGWLSGQTRLPIYPIPDIENTSMYTNRSNELGWMLLRTFPFLQLDPRAFGEGWAVKW